MASSVPVSIKAITRVLKAREIRIPIPFGHIAALEWGPVEGKPVLALHGWLDNARSFDPLIPYLTPDLHIVAIDWPGHGYSSHIGSGGNYYCKLSYVMNVLQVVRYLEWEKFSFLSHSLGALVAISFTSWFPHMVENLITIDILYPKATITINPTDMPTIITRLLELEEREYAAQQECTMGEALDLVMRARPIHEENAKLLLSRSIRPGSKEGLWIFTRDHRVKMTDSPEHVNTDPQGMLAMFKRYTGTWLAIMQKNNQLTPDAVRYEGETEPYTKACKLYRVVHIDEGHFMHMENPQLVASYIAEIFPMPPKL